jgi:murein DD-endopeptidase MepM/ murein hydrolase activator NlpD
MNMTSNFDFENEPLPDHLADTGKVQAIREVPMRGMGRIIGAASLVGAVILTIATIVVVLTPTPAPPPTPVAQAATTQPTALPQPTSVPQTNDDAPTVQVVAPVIQPTIDPAMIAMLLSTPVASSSVVNEGNLYTVVRNTYNPFTVIPERPRTETIQYEVQSGDTIFNIAERFSLRPESIAWANDRRIIGGLRPGQLINVLPVDGALWTVPSEQTVQQVADQFGVDPFTIIDSEFYDLFGMMPDSTLPSGTAVIVPGGEAEPITWTARVETRDTGTSATNSSSGGSGGQVIFEAGDPGSCGWVDNPGNPGTWTYPMSPGSYQWTRGYSSYHTGVDLAGTVGTAVMAANGGSVIFAGWNTYGYGYAVVLAHGDFQTLYGHLTSINVGCGQYVNGGQVIGGLGASGNASGPHLHFEIRYGNVAQDPTYTLPF